MGDEIALAESRDSDGFAPIGHYAVLGDGRGAALVAADGSIDWWALPALDSAPAFAALLDPVSGGQITLRPSATETTATRRYLPHTNLVETTFRTSTGSVRVTDSLNSGTAGVLPWSELARRVEGLDGSVELHLEVRPGDGLRQWQPWAQDDPRGPILHAGALTMGLRCSRDIPLQVRPDHVAATFTVKQGERHVIGVVATEADPLFLCDVDSIDRRVEETADSWRHWAGKVQWEGAGREQIVRSALALKLLIMTHTGSIAAAATTSLPESIGGPKNWDYRYSWIRDAALTIDALAVLGLQEEVHAAVSWLLHAIRDNGPDVHVMYTLTGALPGAVRTPPVPGYRHSSPVMIGNQAASRPNSVSTVTCSAPLLTGSSAATSWTPAPTASSPTWPISVPTAGVVTTPGFGNWAPIGPTPPRK